LRTIPGNGQIIRHADDENIADVLNKGCWTPVVQFGGKKSVWRAELQERDGSVFKVLHEEKLCGTVRWNLLGMHNVNNALAAIAAAHHAGVAAETAVAVLADFKNVKRRLEVKGTVKNIVIYDDFAHHPTAIATTLAGLRAKIGDKARMIAVLEFGSYTMRTGVHKESIKDSLQAADMVVCKGSSADTDWGLADLLQKFTQPTRMYATVEAIISHLVPELKAGDHVVIMSNSGFGGIHQKLLEAINNERS
jgi:UDP-N-acetylmuramate: L-alanyl-gamma-D-glutamyl-meso-diaminopimelate ligase